MGNVKAITDTTNSGQVQTFGYDALDRLITATTTSVGNGQYSESYQYNAIGNITSTSRLGNYSYPASGITSTRPHAATAAGSNRYTYDGNGNMLTRVEVSGTQRITYTQAWDVENRLVAVTNTVTLTVTRFYYDGDGQRVKKVESKNTTSTTTAYLGALYEKNVTTGVTTTYYFAGATRVAMRQAGAVYYLHGDHLGSASLTTNSSGGKVGELRYKPYGETRYIWGVTPTDRRFTGQRSEEASLGSLYDYGARRYSPVLGRFLSADTMVPSPGNPQSLNRYSYVLGNPLKFTDPTGHYIYEEDCPDPTSNGFPTGPYSHANTYFLGPADARAIYGVDTPQRVSMATVIDPTGFGGKVAGLYAMAPGSVRGGILPGGGASIRMPASLQGDVFPEPASFGPTPDYGMMSSSEARALQRISSEYDCTFTVTGSRSETARGLINRVLASFKYDTGKPAPDYGVPEWRNTGRSSGRNEFDYFVRGGDLPNGAKQELIRMYGMDVKFDNWAKLPLNPYATQDPAGITFNRGAVFRNYLGPWQ